MLRLIGSLISLLVIFSPLKSQSLLINEVSNGASGSQEFVELVVTGTCGQTLDIRGYYLDDNCSTSASVGSAAGSARFTQNAQWAAVKAGSIIVIYNGSDVNAAISGADLTDSNCDGVYFIPITAAIANLYIETQATSVGGCAASNYAATTGYGTSNNWSHIGLGNTADLMQIRDASGAAIMAVGYGTGIANPGGTFISFTTSGGSTTFQHTGTNPLTQANWTSNAASALQSPGLPNSCDNAAWIVGMRVVDGLLADMTTWCNHTLPVQNVSCAPIPFSFQNTCNATSYIWSSSDATIASVTPGGSPSGKSVSVAPLNNGMVTITATATNTFASLYAAPNTASCTVIPKVSTQTVTLNITGCAATCAISNVTISPTGACNNNGTPLDPADDYYIADIVVTFTNPPTTGVLNILARGDALPGGGSLSQSVTAISSPYTFTGVRLIADGSPSVFTVQFTDNTSCTFNASGGGVAACSVAPCNPNTGTFPR